MLYEHHFSLSQILEHRRHTWILFKISQIIYCLSNHFKVSTIFNNKRHESMLPCIWVVRIIVNTTSVYHKHLSIEDILKSYLRLHQQFKVHPIILKWVQSSTLRGTKACFHAFNLLKNSNIFWQWRNTRIYFIFTAKLGHFRTVEEYGKIYFTCTAKFTTILGSKRHIESI